MIRRPGETRPALFTDQRATDMAVAAGIQINVVNPSVQENDALRAITKSTGGQYVRVDPSGSELSAQLDIIRGDPPDAALPGDTTLAGWLGDSPAIPLTVALLTSVLLCLSLMVLRR
jgi:hypothetical protein